MSKTDDTETAPFKLTEEEKTHRVAAADARHRSRIEQAIERHNSAVVAATTEYEYTIATQAAVRQESWVRAHTELEAAIGQEYKAMLDTVCKANDEMNNAMDEAERVRDEALALAELEPDARLRVDARKTAMSVYGEAMDVAGKRNSRVHSEASSKFETVSRDSRAAWWSAIDEAHLKFNEFATVERRLYAEALDRAGRQLAADVKDANDEKRRTLEAINAQ